MSKPYSRGYKIEREKMKKGSKYSISCFNCDYYYKTMEDDREVCQNNEVQSYDMVTDNNRVYCTYWKPNKTKEDSLFNKSGRAKLYKIMNEG